MPLSRARAAEARLREEQTYRVQVLRHLGERYDWVWIKDGPYWRTADGLFLIERSQFDGRYSIYHRLLRQWSIDWFDVRAGVRDYPTLAEAQRILAGQVKVWMDWGRAGEWHGGSKKTKEKLDTSQN